MAFVVNQMGKTGGGSLWNYLGKVASKMGTTVKDQIQGTNDGSEIDVSKIDWEKTKQITEYQSMLPYYSAVESFQEYAEKNDLKTNETSIEMINECAYLSHWIYHIDIELTGFDEFEYKKIIKSNKSTQIAQWVFLYSSKLKTAYLVFKGTDVTNPQDILTDLGIIPSPIYPIQGKKEISGHALMDVSIIRDYYDIKQEIISKDINNMYITGHSLGGGLAILFGLRGIIDDIIPLKDKPKQSVQIITFGAPCVVAIEQHMNELSEKSKQYLQTLQNITSCFVNKFDIIPRMLSTAGVKWIDFVTKTTYKYIKNWKAKLGKRTYKTLLTQNMNKEKQGTVTYGFNQLKADTLGFVGQSVGTLVKELGATGIKCKNLIKKEDLGTALTVRISALIDDEYQTNEDEKIDSEESKLENDIKSDIDDNKPEKDIFGSLQNIVESVKQNSKHNLLLYHPFGTYYFYTNNGKKFIISNDKEQIETMLGYIPMRLSWSAETMQMLAGNHSMLEYLSVVNGTLSQISVCGYLEEIIDGIQNGKPCGRGDLFWLVYDIKYTAIGKIIIEKHIADGSKVVSNIREKAFWSEHTFKWRIRFNIPGYANNNIEIAASDDYDELKEIFDKY